MLRIEPLHPDFGARVTGVALDRALPDETVEAIRAAIDEYSFLCFPDQAMDDAKQLALTRSLGEPEPNHVKLGQEGKVDYFGTIGNVLEDGSRLGNSHKRTVFQTGNNMWHSDSSFRPVPTYVSIMCAYEVPEEGGQTEFVSCRAAYGRLPDAMKETIDPLVAVHDYVFSRSKVGPDAVTPSHAASLPPVRQKLVREKRAHGGQELFRRLARQGDRRLELRRQPRVARRPAGARDPARKCLFPRMAARRGRHLGQPLPRPSRQRLRCRQISPPHAPDPRLRRRSDPGGMSEP